MKRRLDSRIPVGRFRLLPLLGALSLLASLPLAWAGVGIGFRQPAVGGISVDAEGVVRAATPTDRTELLRQLRERIAAPAGELGEAAELRMVSLRGLQEALAEQVSSGHPLPEEMQYLAGLQRIEYVFVYPERGDIVLAGPAEPWQVRGDASVVGAHSGRPVLLLDDLMTALRSVETARQGGITCSIEPTAEGRQRFRRLIATLAPGQDPRPHEAILSEAFGPQIIKLNGVPTDSHYARILVAADYQMKRIAMALEPSPVPGLPSYLSLAGNRRRAANENPRWWMACNYDALQRTEDRLAWHLTGQGVKTLTENDLIAADGSVTESGRAEPMAQRWAELMTEQYEKLAATSSVFGDLRNVFDLTVVATLITQERLDELAGCDLGLLRGEGPAVPQSQYDAPVAVDAHCSFLRVGRSWVVTASGGIDVNAFEVVENQQVSAEIEAPHRRAAAAAKDRWWWNG
jgi:hypothetical protein